MTGNKNPQPQVVTRQGVSCEDGRRAPTGGARETYPSGQRGQPTKPFASTKSRRCGSRATSRGDAITVSHNLHRSSKLPRMKSQLRAKKAPEPPLKLPTSRAFGELNNGKCGRRDSNNKRGDCGGPRPIRPTPMQGNPRLIRAAASVTKSKVASLGRVSRSFFPGPDF